MHRSSTVIKLAAVRLATAGAVAAALAQQAPATAPNWNAQSGALQGVVPAPQTNATARSPLKGDAKHVPPRGDMKAPYTNPYRKQDTARGPA